MKATEQLVHDLKKMYLPQNRFANFGNVLLTLDVNGIRGMSASMSMGISNHSYYWKEWIGEEYLGPTGAMLLSLQVARGSTS